MISEALEFSGAFCFRKRGSAKGRRHKARSLLRIMRPLNDDYLYIQIYFVPLFSNENLTI